MCKVPKVNHLGASTMSNKDRHCKLHGLEEGGVNKTNHPYLLPLTSFLMIYFPLSIHPIIIRASSIHCGVWRCNLAGFIKGRSIWCLKRMAFPKFQRHAFV